jgi:hypothetical protein
VIDIGTFLRWLCRIGGFYPAATAVTLRHMPDLPDELERILAAEIQDRELVKVADLPAP